MSDDNNRQLVLVPRETVLLCINLARQRRMEHITARSFYLNNPDQTPPDFDRGRNEALILDLGNHIKALTQAAGPGSVAETENAATKEQ